jgi:hypothetical protein
MTQAHYVSVRLTWTHAANGDRLEIVVAVGEG